MSQHAIAAELNGSLLHTRTDHMTPRSGPVRQRGISPKKKKIHITHYNSTLCSLTHPSQSGDIVPDMWQDNLLVSLDPLTLSCAAESSIKTRLSLVLEGWLIQSGLLFGVYSVSCHSYWEDRSKSVPNRNLYTRIHSLIARIVFVIVDGRIRVWMLT